MIPLQKFMQQDKFRIDAKIYSYFESFKKFICYEELPKFKIQYTDSRNDKNINYKAQISPYQKPIILKYNIAALKENSNDFKYTLVHEFTHLYDYFMQSKSFDDYFIKNNLMLYTEYHAVQIEILFCYNIIDKITDYADIMKTDLTKILDLPSQKNMTYTQSVLRYLDDKTLKNFHMMKTAYMYSCGTSSILSQLTNRNFKLMEFEEPYNKQMKKVYDLLSTVKYNEIPSGKILQQIGNINNKINIHFILNNR